MTFFGILTRLAGGSTTTVLLGAGLATVLAGDVGVGDNGSE
jgi:hypothetical protein